MTTDCLTRQVAAWRVALVCNSLCFVPPLVTLHPRFILLPAYTVRASRLAPVPLIASDSRLIASLIRGKQQAAMIIHLSDDL